MFLIELNKRRFLWNFSSGGLAFHCEINFIFYPQKGDKQHQKDVMSFINSKNYQFCFQITKMNEIIVNVKQVFEAEYLVMLERFQPEKTLGGEFIEAKTEKQEEIDENEKEREFECKICSQ
jgi:hypothetical protein